MLASAQHCACLLGFFGGESGGSRDLDVEVLEGEVFRGGQSTTK